MHKKATQKAAHLLMKLLFIPISKLFKKCFIGVTNKAIN